MKTRQGNLVEQNLIMLQLKLVLSPGPIIDNILLFNELIIPILYNFWHNAISNSYLNHRFLIEERMNKICKWVLPVDIGSQPWNNDLIPTFMGSLPVSVRGKSVSCLLNRYSICMLHYIAVAKRIVRFYVRFWVERL